MRIIVDLPREQIRAVDGYRKREGIPRAETTRRGVASFLARRPGKRFDFRSHPAFGNSKAAWMGDSVEFVRALRQEWER